VGVSKDCQILGTIISRMGKATDFKFCMHIQSEQKPMKNFGKVGPSQALSGVPKISRAAIAYRAHHPVNFAKLR